MKARAVALAATATLATPAVTAADQSPRVPRKRSIGHAIRIHRHHHHRHHRRHRHVVTWSRALASWYYAEGGPIACGGNSYAMGVANRTLPCGTRLVVCFVRCVQAVVFDRGPYVYPRDFDLSQQVANAVGFTGVATIRYRVLEP